MVRITRPTPGPRRAESPPVPTFQQEGIRPIFHHLRLTSSVPLTLGDAQREAFRFVQGRNQVGADELARHFCSRGWALGPRRCAHLLAALGWSPLTIPGGSRIFRRPSPIADGSWRRRARPWLEPVEKDPDLVAAEDRRRRWNLAVLIFAAAAVAWAITMTVRAVL